MNDVLEFLELPKTLDTEQARTRFNQAQVPLSPRLQLLRNRLIRGRAGRLYCDHLPMDIRRPWHARISDKAQDGVHLAFRLANPMREDSPPPMRPETRAFLNDMFRKANAGLSELIGIDVEQKWQRRAQMAAV